MKTEILIKFILKLLISIWLQNFSELITKISREFKGLGIKF